MSKYGFNQKTNQNLTKQLLYLIGMTHFFQHLI